MEAALLRIAALAVLAVVVAMPAGAAASEGVVVHATVDREVVGLGDPFLYVVEARGPSDMIVLADAGPFVVAAPPKRSRSDGGRLVRIEQRLICLDRGCAPSDRRRRVALPPARAISGDVRTVVPRATITVEPRVPETAVRESRARYRVDDEIRPAAAPSRVVPIGLMLLALVCVAAATLLVIPGVVRRRTETGERVRGGLEHALRLLRESARRPVSDRRRAADYVARAAGARGSDVAVEDARRVAWSAREPQPPEVTALADRVETTLGSIT